MKDDKKVVDASYIASFMKSSESLVKLMNLYSEGKIERTKFLLSFKEQYMNYLITFYDTCLDKVYMSQYIIDETDNIGIKDLTLELEDDFKKKYLKDKRVIYKAFTKTKPLSNTKVNNKEEGDIFIA